MTNRQRSSKKFRIKVIRFFLIYLLLIPLVLYLLDKNMVTDELKSAPVLFTLKMAGIALGISLVISFWGQRDPELRKW
ncbi:MAG: hypothetical protein IAE96_09760 [Chitinophagaceae bacterium]|nr:hypothetical protein [Chitinophagaceae bacterium]